MAVPKIELREGEKLWFERWTRPDEAPIGKLWKVGSDGVVISVLPVPPTDENSTFVECWGTGRLIAVVADEDFWPISLEDAQKLFSKSEDSE